MRHGAAQLGLGGEYVAGRLAILLRPGVGDSVATNSFATISNRNHLKEYETGTCAMGYNCGASCRGLRGPPWAAATSAYATAGA